uniref:Mediator of DNA damage checkpoint protein 1 n=1 Tax=Castor canadensis TaxID=51338 RepID=A0A250YME5_CASCN
MEDTQIIDWDIEEEETEQSSESLGDSLEPVGQLRIFSGTHGPEKDFPLYLGKNVIGRSPECTVALPFPSISKQHAVIEILAWNKAPILQDCGSLNGTQILRPPKVLSPGVSHRLRDKELILFADFPCQYHRLDIPLSFVSRGPLTVEETPRVQGGTQPSRLMLAEDSEEEVDFLSERNVVKESRTTSSPLPTVVPESDEEGPSLAPGDSGPSFSGNLESDTDEEKDEQPAVGEASSATRKGTAVKAEKPEADRVIINIRLVKARSSVQRPKDSRVKRDAGDGVGPVGVILERRSQPPEEDSDTDMDEECRPPGRPAVVCLERAHSSSFMGSDTDVEEETIPVTPAIVPMKKKQIFHGVGTRGTESPGLAYLQMSLAGNDTDVKEGEAPLTVPLEGSQTSMVINSDTDDEEEVSAALTLARLKESGAVLWNRDTYVEEGRAQPVALLEQSQTASGRDSDTDMEEEWLPREKRETVPSSHTDENGTIVTAQSEKVQPPLGNSDSEEADVSSPGIHLERSQASSATVGNNTEVEEVVPLGPAVIHLEKNQVSVEGTNETDVEAEEDSELLVVPLKEAWPPDEDWETDVEEDRSSTGTNVRKSQLWAEGDTKTEQATAVLEQERALEMGAQGGSPVAQVEQVVVHPGTLGEPILAQRKGVQIPTGRERKAHRGVTKDSKDSCDDPEDLDLQATQSFVERENQSLEAVQSLEDEPTQAFPFTLPQEPSPSHCRFQTPGTLDEPWEVLATQPFCPKEFEISEPQPIATHLEAHGSCQSPPRATTRDQHPESPVHTEPLGIQGKGMQTMEKDMGTPKRTAERVPPERGLSEREIQEQSPDREKEDVMGEEELTRVIQGREQKQVLAKDTKTQESANMVKSVTPKRDRESSKIEMELSKEIQEKEMEKQILTRKIFGRKVEKPVPDRECKPDGLEVTLVRGEVDGGIQDQKGQATSPTQESGVEAEDLQGFKIVSGNQSGEGRGALVSPRRQQRGHLNCMMPPAEKASWGAPESPDACLPPAVPEASAPPQRPFTSQSPNHPVPQPLLPPSPPSSEPPISRTRHNRSLEISETPPSSELEAFHPKHNIRPRRRSSRMTPSPLSSTPTTPTDQPITPEPTSQATWGRTRRSSVKTLESVVPIATKLHPSTSTVQPVIPKCLSRVTRGKTNRFSVKIPEPVVPTGPELHPSTSTVQPVIPEPTTQASRGRTRRSSVNSPESVVPTASHLQPSISTDHPVTSKRTSRASRGRTNKSSVKTLEPVVPTGSELHPSISTDHPVTPKPTSRVTWGRTNRSSVKTPEPVVPTGPELQLSTSAVQSVTPKPMTRAAWGRACKSSIETPKSVEPKTPDLEPPGSTDQPVIPEAVAQHETVKSLSLSSAPVLTAPQFQSPIATAQPVSLEPIPQASCSRRQRAARKHSSLTPPISNKLPSAPPQPKSRSLRIQRQGALRAAESLGTIPEPSFPQCPELPTHAPQIQKVKVAGTSGFTPEPQPKASQIRKRSSATMDSPPLQKRSQREVSQKTVFPKEEEDAMERPRKEEDVVIPGPGKRKRDQAEEKSKGIPSRGLQRTKPNQESAAPKVLFTGIMDARGERAVLALGGSLAGSVTEASHLVTDRIRRTVKFLCALGKGIPILSLDWLHQSRKAGHFLPPDEYVVTDPEQEKNFGFRLRDALSRAQERRLLEGYEIHVTPGVQPPPPQMGEIISCCGGTVLSNMPRSYKPQRVVITCPQDFPRCSIPSRLGLPLLSPEFLLTGVLKQEAKPEDFVLSSLEISST